MIGRTGLGGSTALDGNVAMNDAIIQHEQALLAQTQQSVACNASHKVRGSLVALALRARDLSDGDTLRLTHVFLSQMLGARRASVTEVAIALEEAGLIHCRRGSIQITDADGLRNSSCECYATVKAHYDRLRQAD